MKFFLTLLSLCASLAAAGVVITPIRPDQVVPKDAGDCWGGVVTPMGCGYVYYSISARTNADDADTGLQAASLEIKASTSELQSQGHGDVVEEDMNHVPMLC
jgi:hypothetical protein